MPKTTKKTSKPALGPAKRLPSGAYAATPELERELLHTPEVVLKGGPYIARVTHSTRSWYEAWTDSQPWVYGPGADTLQGALDGLHAAFEAEQRGEPEAD